MVFWEITRIVFWERGVFFGGLGVSPRGRGCGEDRRAEPRGKAFPLPAAFSYKDYV